MSVDTDPGETDSSEGETDGGGGDAAAGAWRAVPAEGSDGTVRVRWSDLSAMRARIDDLEDRNASLEAEIDRLEAELAATRRGTDATIRRYERLLETRTGTPRPTDGDAEGAGQWEDDDTGILARVRSVLGL